jgi:hypothetical protein
VDSWWSLPCLATVNAEIDGNIQLKKASQPRRACAKSLQRIFQVIHFTGRKEATDYNKTKHKQASTGKQCNMRKACALKKHAKYQYQQVQHCRSASLLNHACSTLEQ